ncbi:hypothetical protein IFT73_17865 [Aeromicrobium sp. CFBP 8757]|uniref:hypothetical protein n=1 Tax=Aeromicrobium sp. CFBP 8757 TaxID=2775288 RepID=UPI0017831ABC|nr:hypothetical protein [Aeromicrobium sp. CFBP 8757]MBD8608726.1 hypothetical protein [Aeromicrobium sp. CFBP 8757]
MTEPQTITIDHVHALLQQPSDDAVLGLVEGRVEAIDPDQLATDDYRGALEVISRRDLAERLGSDPTDEALAEQAGALTASVQQLGG